MRPLLPLLALLALLAGCAAPVDLSIVLQNDTAETIYVDGWEQAPLVGVREIDGDEEKTVWASPEAACMRRCGAPAGQIACIAGAAYLSVPWAVLPGDEVAVDAFEEPWVEGFDAFGQCVKRTTLDGDIAVWLCQAADLDSGGAVDEPTETGPVGDGVSGDVWLLDPLCGTVEAARDPGVLRVPLRVDL